MGMGINSVAMRPAHVAVPEANKKATKKIWQSLFQET
jgi:hypothetical protein